MLKERIGERHASACRYKNDVPEGSRRSPDSFLPARSLSFTDADIRPDRRLSVVRQVVLSSESMHDLTQVEAMIRSFGSASLIFSLDLKHGKLLVDDPAWQGKSPLDLVRFVIERGIRQLIVLDLAAVGTGLGIPTLQLCQDIRRMSPDIRIISGGGVDSAACVADAAQAGLDGLLIASALHDGRLTADDLAEYLHL